MVNRSKAWDRQWRRHGHHSSFEMFLEPSGAFVMRNAVHESHNSFDATVQQYKLELSHVDLYRQVEVF